MNRGTKIEVASRGAHMGNRLAVDFPGWGADNYADFLIPLEDGLRGEITSVESHGAFPYTRYTVRFEDGTRASGLDPQILKVVR